jgi:hypothetical protein
VLQKVQNSSVELVHATIFLDINLYCNIVA